MRGWLTEERPKNPFIGGDPLIIIVRKNLHISKIAASIAIVFLLNIPSTYIIIKDSLWYSTTNKPGILNDPGFWLLNIIVFPVTVYFFLWMPDGICGVIDGLVGTGAISREGSKLSRFIIRFSRLYTRWAWAVLCITFSATFMVILLPTYAAMSVWWTTGEFIYWYTLLTFTFYIFLVSLIVVRLLLAIYGFNQLFSELDIQVRILHPDMAGGLSPLGNFSVKIGYLIGVYGVALVLLIYSNEYIASGNISPTFNLGIFFAGFLYLVLAPIAFFAPIGSAHSAMAVAKDDFALKVSKRFDAVFSKLQESLTMESGEMTKDLTKIKQLQEMHSLAMRFPIWPFNTTSLVRFFSSILFPFLLALISAVLNWVLHP